MPGPGMELIGEEEKKELGVTIRDGFAEVDACAERFRRTVAKYL